MSLHDVDKSSHDRGSPMPNRPDQLMDESVKAHKTISTQYKTGADTNPGRLQMLNKQIIGYDGTTPITLYGYNAALDKWGFFATKAGTDVTANTDLSKFVFNSTQDAFKIVQTASVTQTLTNSSGIVTAGTQTFSIAHSLGYVPAFMVYVTGPIDFIDGGILFQLPHMSYNSFPDAGSVFTRFYATADSTNLMINYQHRSNTDYSPGTPTFSVRYYLLQETAT